MRIGWLVTLLFCTSCAIAPRDPFVRAERALGRHDLGGALLAFDSVPVVHARYPEARAAAVVVERNMRRCHELLLDALMLRGEWRDQEALVVLERARTMWPMLPGVDGLIAATRMRLQSLGGAVAGGSPSSPAAADRQLVVMAAPLIEPMRPLLVVSPPSVEPIPLVTMPIEPNEPVGGREVFTHTADVATGPDAAPSAPSASSVPPAPSLSPQTPAVAVAPSTPDEPSPISAAANDPVALGLVAVEGKLRQGELQPAVAALLDLARRFPDDQRVRSQLARLLHQRALIRYGEGALSEAITDWQRVLQIEPNNRTVRSMLQVAESESRRAPQ